MVGLLQREGKEWSTLFLSSSHPSVTCWSTLVKFTSTSMSHLSDRCSVEEFPLFLVTDVLLEKNKVEQNKTKKGQLQECLWPIVGPACAPLSPPCVTCQHEHPVSPGSIPHTMFVWWGGGGVRPFLWARVLLSVFAQILDMWGQRRRRAGGQAAEGLHLIINFDQRHPSDHL